MVEDIRIAEPYFALLSPGLPLTGQGQFFPVHFFPNNSSPQLYKHVTLEWLAIQHLGQTPSRKKSA